MPVRLRGSLVRVTPFEWRRKELVLLTHCHNTFGEAIFERVAALAEKALGFPLFLAPVFFPAILMS